MTKTRWGAALHDALPCRVTTYISELDDGSDDGEDLQNVADLDRLIAIMLYGIDSGYQRASTHLVVVRLCGEPLSKS